MDYLTRKLSGQCVYKGCPNPCSPDHLMCEPHGDKHRQVNARHMRVKRGVAWKQLHLWLSPGQYVSKR
jgi:hypothetical protein